MNVLLVAGMIAIFLGILTAILNLAAVQDIEIKKEVCFKASLSIEEMDMAQSSGVYETLMYPFPLIKTIDSFEFIHFIANQNDGKKVHVICPIVSHEITYRENIHIAQKKIKTLIFHISPEIYRGTSIENIIV